MKTQIGPQSVGVILSESSGVRKVVSITANTPHTDRDPDYPYVLVIRKKISGERSEWRWGSCIVRELDVRA